jgi:hypothetical protein
MTTPARRPWGTMVVLAVAYVACAWLGVQSPLLSAPLAVVWPAAGIAMAAVLLLGPGIWPGIWVGAFAAAMLGFGIAHPGQAWPELAVALVIATGNTLDRSYAVRAEAVS